MSAYNELKKLWNKFGVIGHVKNLSSQSLWILDDSGAQEIRISHLQGDLANHGFMLNKVQSLSLQPLQ